MTRIKRLWLVIVMAVVLAVGGIAAVNALDDETVMLQNEVVQTGGGE